MQLQSLDSNTKARVVRKLHLRVPREDDGARTRIALEDGLATADFGDAGRLILVRRLALPKLVGDLSGPMAARAIEASYRSLLPTAVHGGDPRAPRANIIWFEDRLEALLEALSICVHERPLDAWFWRPALGRPVSGGRADMVPALFQAISVYGRPGQNGTIGLRALAQRWRGWSTPSFTRFLRLLPTALLDTADLSIPLATEVDSRRDSDTLNDGDEIPETALKVIDKSRARISAALEVGLEQAAWVIHWELVAAGVVPSPDSILTLRALVASVVTGEFESTAPTTRNARHESVIAVSGSESLTGPSVSLSSSFDNAKRTPAEISPASEHTQSTALRSPVEEFGFALPPWLSGAVASTHGGFFMLLNAWHALGFQDWMTAQATELQAAMAKVWLGRWATRLRVSEEDPQQAIWQQLPESELPVSCYTDMDEWAMRTRRWLRTRALIGPASLVLRAGAVCVTRTHIDIVFPLQAIDLRIRRAGLDFDPGWVAWLGRIVTFHYIDSD